MEFPDDLMLDSVVEVSSRKAENQEQLMTLMLTVLMTLLKTL